MNFELVVSNLTNPTLLFFVLGIFATIVKSDLEIPSTTVKFISLYLLFSIGFKGGQELTLRFKEFELLSLLMGRVGDTVTRAELFDQVWGTDWLGDTRTLDVHVRWLREKIEDDPSHPLFIQTVRSVGYRFARQEEPA